MLFNQLHALWHPASYHGWGRSKRFFEGWYYKLVSLNETHAFAIIPRNCDGRKWTAAGIYSSA